MSPVRAYITAARQVVRAPDDDEAATQGFELAGQLLEFEDRLSKMVDTDDEAKPVFSKRDRGTTSELR